MYLTYSCFLCLSVYWLVLLKIPLHEVSLINSAFNSFTLINLTSSYLYEIFSVRGLREFDIYQYLITIATWLNCLFPASFRLISCPRCVLDLADLLPYVARCRAMPVEREGCAQSQNKPHRHLVVPPRVVRKLYKLYM